MDRGFGLKNIPLARFILFRRIVAGRRLGVRLRSTNRCLHYFRLETLSEVTTLVVMAFSGESNRIPKYREKHGLLDP